MAGRALAAAMVACKSAAGSEIFDKALWIKPAIWRADRFCHDDHSHMRLAGARLQFPLAD
jgi:hypothetical protein